MLTAPWALWALVSIPIVLGIYFFRTRSRRRDVSSLFLWVDRTRATQGGRRVQRLQLPLLVLLELLILALLVFAAAKPMFRIDSMGHPTAIVLDCSYSMSAGNDSDSAKQRAVDDISRMLETRIGFPVQFVLAGAKPQVIAGRAKNVAEARESLQSWTCDAPTANLDAAVSLTANIVTPGTKILVVTDQAPTGEVSEGKVLWKSYGKPLDNMAIVHAGRVFREEKDRLLLEIANFSENPRTLRMTIVEPKQKSVLFRDERLLESKAVHRIRTGIPDGIGAIDIRLDDDALPVDNRLTMLPPNRRPVRVRIDDLSPDLASKVRRAVETSGIATLVKERPEIRFASTSETPVDSPVPVWTVRIVEPDSEKVKSFIGPFIVDHGSPLTEGISLDGTVWSADESWESPGSVIFSAGEVPLLTERRLRNGSRLLTLQLNDRLSTLTSSPTWPILIWNILKYRASQTTGIVANNLKLGTEAEWIPAEGDANLDVVPPQGEARKIAVSGPAVRIPADQVGVFRLTAESGSYEFAVGTLSAEESDLLKATTATFGNWFDEETLRTEFQSVVWILLLAALALLTVHHALISVAKTEAAK